MQQMTMFGLNQPVFLKEEEIWKPIPSFDGYMASNLGNIKTMKGIKFKNNILKPATRKDNYLQVSLRKDGKNKSCLVHRLIAETFLKFNEINTFVNHIDGNKANNNLSNLETCSAKENINHKHYVLKKNVKPVICVETGVVYDSIRQAERITGIGSGEISKCCRKIKRYKTAGGFSWKYKEEN